MFAKAGVRVAQTKLADHLVAYEALRTAEGKRRKHPYREVDAWQIKGVGPLRENRRIMVYRRTWKRSARLSYQTKKGGRRISIQRLPIRRGDLISC